MHPITKTYPYLLIVGSLIGLLASFFLMLSTIELIKDPAAQVPCNLSPFVSCSGSATSWQGEVFGFPNPLLGIASFSMLFAIGIMLFSGGRSRKPLWLLVNLGTLASFIFIVWFIYQSMFRIGSLCIYCMITWIVTWPIFLYTTIWNFKENHFEWSGFKASTQKKINSFFDIVSDYHVQILTVWYLAVIFLALFRFKDFFFS